MKRHAASFLLFLNFVLCFAGADISSLKAEIEKTVREAPGIVGVAFISGKDTFCINNGQRFPLMSVFKLHQALAVAHELESRNVSIDSMLSVKAAELDRQTWSPMLKDVGEADFEISISRLLEYSLVVSDNNASNILFDHIVNPQETDAFVRSVSADSSFRIIHSEREMKARHELSYGNYSSPLACARLIADVYKRDLVSEQNSAFIRETLMKVTTGDDRLDEPLREIEGVCFAHKTGSGYRNEAGELIAFNDVAYIVLPDGTDYALAVLIRDFTGTEGQAAAVMARISALFLEVVVELDSKDNQRAD